MNKKILGLSLLGLLLTGCAVPKVTPTSSASQENPVSEQSMSIESSSITPVSSSTAPSSSSSQTQVANNGTLEHPYTAAECIALCDAFGSEKEGKFINNAEIYITGTFDAGTKVDTQYNSWEGLLDGTGFSVWSCKVASGININKTNGALDGKKVVIKGYVEYYGGKYQCGYLPAASSPTKAKYNPTILKVEDGGSTQGGGGGQTTGGDATKTYGIAGSKDSTAETKVYDLAAGKTQCPEYNDGDKNIAKDITISEEYFKECNCYNSSNVNYWQFGAKKYGAHAWLANQTAISGKIVGLVLKVPSGASGNTRYHFGFATSVMNESFVDGTAIKPVAEGSQSSLSSDVDMVIVPSQGGDFRYFNITAEFLEKNQFNGGAVSVTILYK